MRCYCCNSPEANWIHCYDEWYCDECLNSIDETIQEWEEDLDDLVEGLK